MPSSSEKNDLADALKRFADFRSPRNTDRIFTHPIAHPTTKTGFCFCDRSPLHVLCFSLLAAFTRLVFWQPLNAPRVWLLRKLGACVGRNVYVSAGAWFDPLFPDLVTIEDDVMIGFQAKIMTHEFRIDHFFAGKVVICKAAVVGGFSLIGPGVEIGERASVAGGAVVGRDVPPRATAIGNPARIIADPEDD